MTGVVITTCHVISYYVEEDRSTMKERLYSSTRGCAFKGAGRADELASLIGVAGGNCGFDIRSSTEVSTKSRDGLAFLSFNLVSASGLS